MVTKPKLKGGLGVINLWLQNEVLLMKNLHKFFNTHDLPWVNLIWTKYYSNRRVPGHTMKGSFWWKENVTLLTAMNQQYLHDNFQLPLSEQAFDQLCELELLLQTLQLNESGDQWKYIWGSNQYSSSKAYMHLISSQPVHPVYRWLWISSCQQKHKVFYWLLIKID